ncbi:nicotinamidase/pyrazinamidase [Nakamurella sp. UYEF19]|uniref:isochorismatase family protein n=1 Tax=Nakamurella sp. UYEF19 TaxID=1756392 RepID=UPI0033968B99
MTAPTTFDATTALVVVDMQHDFADPTGSLYVSGGEEILPGIVEQIEGTLAAGGLVVYTQDWHPEHTPHFQIDGGLWPVHCVIDTPGAALVPGLPVGGPIVKKGSGPEDSYSGFSVLNLETGATTGTELSTILDENGIMAITVVGLAGDWCVKATAIDGVSLGYRTTVPLSFTRFVELQPGDTEAAVAAMKAAGVLVTA